MVYFGEKGMEKNSFNNRGFFVGRRTLFVVFILLLVPLLGIACNAGDVEDYAPILYFEGEETCYPVDVSYLIGNSADYDEKPAETIAGLTFTCYDNTHGTANDDGVIKDYQSKLSSLGYTVYYHEYEESEGKVIQYWMFYAFNDGDLNRHEGDWEMVQVVIPASGSKWVAYSQHHSGQYGTWDQVEKEGTHIKVYVARGSHANYLRSYSGKLGMASDYVGDNGKILKYGTGSNNYNLIEITDTSPSWVDDLVLWGEYGGPQDSPLGRNGPPGPLYRGLESENQMWDGVTWGNSLTKADNNFFLLEWFIYNFVMIFIAITVLSLILILVRIYFRYKKHGLGPRIISILYIDGINLKSIGNIVFFVGVILAIVGLFTPWYSVSTDIDIEGYPATGNVDVISIDGINGFQLTIPGITGSIPMGTLLLPFSLLIGISIVFLFLACIGIPKSKKLGLKYIGRGFRFMIPIIMIIVIIAMIGSALAPMAKDMQGGTYAAGLLNSISSSPMGGQETFTASELGVNGQFAATWGVAIGGYMLLFSGVLLLIAGAMEVFANKDFFTPKNLPMPKPKKAKPVAPPAPVTQPVVEQPPVAEEPKKEETPKANFCSKCGAQVGEGEKFCGKCGEKV